VDGGYFHRVGLDTYGIIDIVFVAITALGILFIGLFARLVLKPRKQLRGSDKTKSKPRIRWLIGLILSIIGLLFFYVIAPMLFAVPFNVIRLLLPASMTTAIIAVWVMLGYFLVCLWGRVFVSSRLGK